VFSDERAAPGAGGRPLISAARVRTGRGNIAGVDIPVFEGADFEVDDYDLFVEPLWIDPAVERLKEILLLDLELRVLGEQLTLLSEELRTTSQRVNLFEKVKVPETLENIRKIRISLGDQQVAQVVRGKIAKRKVVEGAAA